MEGAPFINRTAKYLIVRDFPRPTDSADSLLRALPVLASKGLDLKEVAVTYAVKCSPPFKKLPPKKSKDICRENYLAKEIESLQPEVIVCLGGQAGATVIGTNNVSVEKNRRIELTYGDIPVFVTYHPTFIELSPHKTRTWLEDLYSALIGDKETEPDFNIRLVNTYRGLESLQKEYSGFEGEVLLDLEWVPETKEILMVGVAFGDSPIYVIPAAHPESRIGSDWLDWFKQTINRPEITVLGHYIKADLTTLFLDGEVIKCLADDSMMWHYLLDESGSNRKLKTLAKEFTPYSKLDDEVDSTKIKDIDLRLAARYCGIDVGLPPVIRQKIKETLEHYEQYSPRMVEYNKRLIPFLSCMESAGIAVDIGRLREVTRDQTNKLEDIGVKLKELAPEVENLDSPVQLSAYLFGEKGGFSNEKLAEIGILHPLNLDVPDVKNNWGESFPRTAEHVINALEGEQEFVTTLKEHRSVAKEIRTYANGVSKNLVFTKKAKLGGMVYPHIFPATSDEGGGTVSGRLSIKNPPMQTVKKTMDIASVFISRYGDEGLLWGIDGSQFELRWGAMESRDPFLCDIFANRKDPHGITAELGGISRKEGKTVNFASIYGCSIKKLKELGLSHSVAKRVKNALEQNWKVLYSFIDGIKKQVLYEGYTATPYGRYRRLPGARNKFSREILQGANFRLQAPANEVCQLLGYLLMVRGEGVMIPILTNHDGLVFDSLAKDRARVLDIIKQCVLELKPFVKQVLGIDLTIPFEFTVEEGTNFQNFKETHIYECS